MASSYTSRLGDAPEEGIKAPVVATATSNITLSGEQTVSGVAVVAGDRVCVTGQTDAAENGLYKCAVGAWTRTVDFNAANDVVNGVLVLDSGTSAIRRAQFTGAWTPDTTSVTFTLLSNLSEPVQSVDNVAALALVDTAALVAGDVLYVMSYATAGDGGHGWWRWSTADLSAEVAVDTRKMLWCPPSGEDGSTGAWVRQWVETLFPEWAGAAGDGTDDVAPLQAVQTVAAYVDAAEIRYSSMYGTTEPINLAVGVLHNGGAPGEDSPRHGLIALNGFPTTSSVLSHTVNSPVAWAGFVSGVGAINIQNMAFDGATYAPDGLLLVGTASARLDNIWINECSNDGLVIDATQNSLYSKITILRCQNYGLRILNFARNSTLANVNIRFVGVANVKFEQDTAYPGSGIIAAADRPQEITWIGGVLETPYSGMTRDYVMDLTLARYCVFIGLEIVNSTALDLTTALVNLGTDAGSNTFLGCIFNAQGGIVPAVIDAGFENEYLGSHAITFGTGVSTCPAIFQCSNRAIFRDIGLSSNFETLTVEYTGAGSTPIIWHPKVSAGLYSARPTEGKIEAYYSYYAYDLSTLLVYDPLTEYYRPTQCGGERTKTDAATTYDVTALSVLNCNDTGATAVATLTGGVPGQELKLRFVNANTTLTNAAGGTGQIITSDGADIVSADKQLVTLLYSGTTWYEVSRAI